MSSHVAEQPPKSRLHSAWWGTIACGAGLFSDGYLNAIIGNVNAILKRIYKKEYSGSDAMKNVSSIAFAGIVVGQLFFGWTSDHISRKWSLVVSTIILIVFAILGTASYGAGGSIQGMFAALTAYRFFLGIGIGGEYPAGSVGCAEHSASLKSGTRNRWFITFTNVMIDLGFVLAPLIAMIVVLATTENHLRAAWRICLGIGVIWPLSLLYIRIKLREPEPFTHEKMTVSNTPWLLAIRFYWFRLTLISLVWFIYNFCVYALGIYFSTIVDNLMGDNSELWRSFGWNTLVSLFYMPGAILGSFAADSRFGAKRTLVVALTLMAIVGFGMAAGQATLYKPKNVAGFTIVYGIFLALGELGPGDNIGLFASKTCSSAIRGKYYGIAAATGKIGGFVGTRVFPEIGKKYADLQPEKQTQMQFYVASGLVLVAVVCALFFPTLDQDIIANEDLRFRNYLESHGYDTTQMGLKGPNGQPLGRPVEVVESAEAKNEKEFAAA